MLDDGVHHSQQLFRQLLSAMSEPGTQQTLAVAELPAGAQLSPAAWAAVLTLCDLDTRLWVEPRLATPGLYEAVAFHTGASITESPADADFALVVPQTLSEVTSFAEGSDAWPDRSTTLIVVTDSLAEGNDWVLSGPGIADCRGLTLSAEAVPLMARLSANLATFPRGLDAFITAGHQLLAVARSTRVEARTEHAARIEEDV
ncbi:carbon-phosphorus lyase complex subunit [Halomonas cupida]|nr:carbon-phosphorus lyase complex subunit [Halomonas cupida]